MRNLIKIKDFSDIKKFRNKDEAEKFRNKKNIDLIIWGDFSADNLKKEGKIINKLNLNFTYGHPNDKNGKLGAMLLADIQSKFARKNYWQIFEENSITDIEIISDNIFDLSIYIIAFTLKIYGRIGKSIHLFEKLLIRLSKNNDTLAQDVILHLLNCYEILIQEIGVFKKNWSDGEKLCKKMLSFNEKNFFAISNLAFFQYKLNKSADSQSSVELLNKYFKDQPLTLANTAFMSILNKAYKKAYRCYENLTEYPIEKLSFNPIDVVEFLNFEYEKNKESALLYGSGIVSQFYGDKKIAKQDLKLFLKKSNDVDYHHMRLKAKKLLKKY